MLGSVILNAVIGLVFVYVLLSLLCWTVSSQVIDRFFNVRARTVHEGIINMLADPALVQQLYDHPLIRGLSQNAAYGKPRKPSYIPADIFATALMSTDVVQAYKNNPYPYPDIPIPRALELVVKNAGNDAAQELANIEKWYNSTMDQVSGWYKRRMELIIFIVGLVITIGLNLDTFSIVSTLSSSTVHIQALIGWSTLPTGFGGWVLKFVGWLVTIFAVSLGAPFWFDVLNKFVPFKSSGTPPKAGVGTSG